MRTSHAFVPSVPLEIRQRRIQRTVVLRNSEGAVVQFAGGQVISIGRIAPQATEADTSSWIRSILAEAGHLPAIIESHHGVRPTGPCFGGPAPSITQPLQREAAVRIAFDTKEATLQALTFLRESAMFTCKITLCRAPPMTQTVINDLRTHFVLI